MTTTHHTAGTSTNTTCDMTSAWVQAHDHLVSIFSKDVTCIACLDKIAAMKAAGFIPKH